jgi:hypothetical protein
MWYKVKEFVWKCKSEKVLFNNEFFFYKKKKNDWYNIKSKKKKYIYILKLLFVS